MYISRLKGIWCTPLSGSSGLFSMHLLNLVLRIVCDHKFHRIDHSHHACRHTVQIIAHGMLQQRDTVEPISYFVITDRVNGKFRWIRAYNPATHTAYGRHSRIIPSGHMSLLHQLQQLAFRHHGICKVQTIEFNLSRAIVALPCQFLGKILIQRTVRHTNSNVQIECVTPSKKSLWPWAKSYMGYTFH